MSAHTPTPWRTAGTVLMAEVSTAIADIDGDNGESIEDAEFIVLACNAHDELVAALELMVDSDLGEGATYAFTNAVSILAKVKGE